VQGPMAQPLPPLVATPHRLTAGLVWCFTPQGVCHVTQSTPICMSASMHKEHEATGEGAGAGGS